MLGYIVPDKPELKIREYELYSGYYCGICKSIAKRYGQMPRLVLNYDSVLLALILASLFPENEAASMQRCPVHPMKKRLIVSEDHGIDYAADMMLLLANFKVQDDLLDEGGLKPQIGSALLSGSYKKLMKKYPKKCIMVEEKLAFLHKLEHEKCTSLDQAAEPFAKLMEEIFAEENICAEKEIAENLRLMGYHIGKWIYLIDAFDDIEENKKDGTYNPLLYGPESPTQEEGKPEKESMEAFRERIRPRIEFNLLYYLAELAAAWEKLDTEKNRPLIDNIIYKGLLRKTEQILQKGTTENAKSI